MLIEALAALFVLSSVISMVNRKIWAWPLNIVAVILYFFVFKEQSLYFDMGLQVVFFFQSLYAWYNWKNNVDVNNKINDILLLKRKIFLFHISGLIILSFVFGYILFSMTDDPIPYLDAFTAFGAILANTYIMNRIYQGWIIWVVVDIAFLFICYKQDLWFSFGLHSFLTILSMKGMFNWKNKLTTKFKLS